MSFSELIKLSWKYLLRYRRRYMFLFFALAFSFCIVTVITSVKEGVRENLYISGQSHYTGDIVFLGEERDGLQYERRLDSEDKKAIYETVSESGIAVTRYAERTLVNDDAMLYFNGSSLNLLYLNGVDWNNEKVYFDSLNYAAGNADSLSRDSIIISEQVASVLGAQCGDNILLELENNFGQKNSAVFVLSAVIRDKTLFGLYKAYIQRNVMNEIIAFDPDDCSSIGFFLKNRNNAEKAKSILQEPLSKKARNGAVIYSDAAYRAERASGWSGIKIFIYTIPVYLHELYQLIEALDIINYFLYTMMLVIIFVSSSVTYRLVLHERTREIGTMRAIGFKESAVRCILTVETFILGIFSIAAGFILALVSCAFLSRVKLNLPSFDIMLSGGTLTAVFLPLDAAINIVAVLIILLVAVSIPASRASGAHLAGMLSGSEKG